MKVEDLIGDSLRSVRRIGEDVVELIFQDERGVRIEAGIYGSYKHPDGIAGLRMKMIEAVVEEEGP